MRSYSCLKLPRRGFGRQLLDSPNLMPKVLLELVSSIVILEGDGGVGTIGQSKFTSVAKDFTYWKDRVDAIDDQKRVFKYSVIEGGLIGKKVKSTSLELKFELASDGGSVCKFNAKFEPMKDSLPIEEVTKEIMGGMTGMFKAIEGYLLANPGAYICLSSGSHWGLR